MLREYILEPPAHLGGHSRQGVHRHCLAGAVVEWTDIVQPDYVVVVFVGKQNSVEMFQLVAKHLLPKIRTSVDEHVRMTIGHQCGRSQTIVQRVIRSAYSTIATNDGNTLRGTCAEKYDFHRNKGKMVAEVLRLSQRFDFCEIDNLLKSRDKFPAVVVVILPRHATPLQFLQLFHPP